MSPIMGKAISKPWLIFIVFYVLLIYISLPFARTILNHLYASLGKDVLSLSVNILLLIFILYTSYKLFKKGIKAIILTVTVLLIAFLFASDMERPEERIHFIQYGLLGFLMFKMFKSFSFIILGVSVLMLFLVGGVDEIIQYFLPNRVGDIRDVIFNFLGGLLGLWVGYIYFYYR